MKKNTKAISTTLIVVIVVAIVVIAAVIVGVSMSTPPTQTADNAVTIYINSMEQTGNYTTPRTIDWGAVSPGNTYTKNFTVESNSDQPLQLKLYTTEPEGCTQLWAKNGTTLSALGVAESTLVLTLDDLASSGTYTWMLLAVNGTMPTPTPTASPQPTPTPTPEPNSLEFTIQGDNGVKNITVTVNSEDPFVIVADSLPKTYLFTAGDKLKFKAELEDDYLWNGWEYADGTLPNMDNPIIVTKTANFTITATTILP